MADAIVENSNKVAQPEPTTNIETKTSDAIDADTGKTAEAPLAPADPGKQAVVASVDVSEPTNEAPPSIAKGDLSSKVDAADTLAQQPEKQTDQVPTPVSQEPVAESAETPATALEAQSKLPPKPVSVEEVKDEEMPTVNPTTTCAPQTDGAVKATSNATSEPAPEKTEPGKSEPDTGDKRKAGEADSTPVESKPTHDGAVADEPAEKMQKTNGAATNGITRKKPGRPKKEKKAPAPVGRTLRKTRSQGAAEVQTPNWRQLGVGVPHVKKWVEAGIPIDGIDERSISPRPWTPWPGPGVPDVAITESDITGAASDDYGVVTGARLQVETCVGITTWGVSDGDSWGASETPLPFDANYQPKGAYWAVADALTQ
ncbi:hypothetical protein DL765_005206 [Monosporascus sp. GIB2]|nr:hypothetical protein DL765_005206 [Monosporascus sp. GIB2]